MTHKELQSLAWEYEAKYRPAIICLASGKNVAIVRSKEIDLNLLEMCRELRLI